VFEIKAGKVTQYTPKLLEIMQNVMNDKETFDVPIEAEVKVGNNWAQMTKVKK
jgi:DNA polymerase I-like protein with 3'-5' exonuclease and polymerase domains